MRVMMRGHDLDEQMLGALHDVFERSTSPWPNMEKKGFLTARAESHGSTSPAIPEETYEQYIDRVVLDNSPSA
jgi:hypothetical protein